LYTLRKGPDLRRPVLSACASIPPGASLVVAVSGGCDSVGLLYVLRPMAASRGWRLTVAHLDHGIRGAEGRADVAFVRSLARRWSLPVRVGRANVPLLARRRRQSLEAAAREVRYDFLSRVARRAGAYAILTAHTADDQAETVVMNLCRGSGLAGLAGIPHEAGWRGVRIVRPLLAVSRRDLEASLRGAGVAWREDTSNADLRHTRNRVRHVVLPMLERTLNPSVRRALCRLADICRAETETRASDDARALDALAGQGIGLSVSWLRALGRAERRRVLRLWLARSGLPGATLRLVSHVEALAARQAGSAEIHAGGGRVVRRVYGRVRVTGTDAGCAFRKRLEPKGVTRVVPPGLRVQVGRICGAVKTRPAMPGALPAVCTLDAKRIGRRTLWMRSWKPGDRIRPFGMNGSRKVQDILTDAKVPREARWRVPLVECDGEVVWIPGYRVSRDWAVPSGAAPSVRIAVAALPIRASRGGRS